MRTIAKGCILGVLALSWAAVVLPAEAARQAKENRKKSQWVWSNPKEPAGCKFKAFRSEIIKQEVSYLVWFPPGWKTNDTSTRYPVVYFLHGGGGNYEHIPAAFLPQAAEAIEQGRMPAFIGVVVNGLPSSLYVNSVDGAWPVESMIMKELLPHIDRTYPTDPKRRVLEGFSMGGYGATHLAFKYPGMFVGVADFAGAVHSWEFFGHMTNINPVWGSEERFLAEWPLTLAKKNADLIQQSLRQVFIAVGDLDTSRGSTLEANRKLHQLLNELKIPTEFVLVPQVKHSYQNLCAYPLLAEKHIAFYATVLKGNSRP